MYPSSDLNLSYETADTLYFFTSAFEPFDHFSAHSIELWSRDFPTAEHAYQWKKFETTDIQHAERIRAARSPFLAKKMAYEQTNIRDDWAEVKNGFMEETLRAKVLQYDDVRNMLMSTGNKQIVENSPVDSYWGAGPDGNGENHIGKLLVKIRGELKNDL